MKLRNFITPKHKPASEEWRRGYNDALASKPRGESDDPDYYNGFYSGECHRDNNIQPAKQGANHASTHTTQTY